MLKAVFAIYIMGAVVASIFSTLYFAIQIFRPDVNREELLSGDPKGPPPGKIGALVIKLFILLFLTVLTLLAAAVWPIFLLISIGGIFHEHIAKRRRNGKENDYRR